MPGGLAVSIGANPVAAIAIAALLVREGREAWEGDDCC